jgi:hypothetical protein
MSRMQELENMFKHAEKANYYVAVVVEMDGFPRNEVIINHPDNIAAKLDYYKKTYKPDCEHKHAAGVRIVDCAIGDSFEQIETLLNET